MSTVPITILTCEPFTNPVLELAKLFDTNEPLEYGRCSYENGDYRISTEIDYNENITLTIRDFNKELDIIHLSIRSSIQFPVDYPCSICTLQKTYNNQEIVATRFVLYKSFTENVPMFITYSKNGYDIDLFDMEFTEEEYFQKSTVYELLPQEYYKCLANIFKTFQTNIKREGIFSITITNDCDISIDDLNSLLKNAWAFTNTLKS